MRFWMTGICCCLACSALGYAQSLSEPPVRPRPKSQLQALRALEISKLAAENDMHQLSLRAVSDAFAGGPPTTFVAKANPMPGGLVRSGTVFGTGLPQSKPKVTTTTAEILQNHLRQLCTIWKDKNIDPRLVYETLTNVVLPPGRPDEVFFHEQTLSATVLNTGGELQPFNAGALLVEWTLRAGTQDDLNQRLERLKSLPTGQLTATVLQCMLAIEARDNVVLRERLSELRIHLNTNSTGSDAEVAAQLVFPLLGSPDVSSEAASVAELVIDQIVSGTSTSKNYHVEPATSILKVIAETYRKSGNEGKVRETVGRLLNANSQYNNRYSSGSNNYVQRLRQAQVNTAASIFLNAGMFADAAPLMAEYYELQAATGRSFRSDHGARLFRVLMTLDPEKQYDLLRTLTFSENENINLSAALVPRLIPLPIFAEAVSSGNGQANFDLPAIGPQRDVLHSAALLAKVARQIGKLAELQAQSNRQSSSPPAELDVVKLFAQLESTDPDFNMVKKLIRERTTSLELLSSDTNSLKVRLDNLNDYSIAARSVDVPEVREVAVELLEVIRDSAQRVQNSDLHAHAEQTLNHVGLVIAGINSEMLLSPNLRHWHLANCESDQTHASGTVATTWVAQDGYVKALTAPENGLLYFRYPLTGQFEISAVVSEGDGRQGGFVYDGMLSGNQGKSQDALLMHIGRSSRKSPRVTLTNVAANAGLNSLELHEGATSYRINRHVVAVDTVSGSSPFFALHAGAGAKPGFRQLQISGSPQIPREVRLLSDHRLRGWAPYHSIETICSAFEAKDAGTGSWLVENGVLQGPQVQNAPLIESALFYQRPVMDGEQVSWEFEYKPNASITHPALGRLVFMLRPDGVRLHWLTDGDSEWSGLPGDHEVTDKAAQKSTQLPLLPNAWNKAELTLRGRTVQLSLNGQLVFEREHEIQLETQFGFFHNRRAETVAVRDVVLSGDWPQTYEAAVKGDLLEFTEPPKSVADGLSVPDFISADEFESMGYQFARDAELLPSDKRFSMLKRWVLPESSEREFRMMGGFVPSDLHEVNDVDQNANFARKPASLVSPALDMVNTAAELNKLKELKQNIKALQLPEPSSGTTAQRAILSTIATAEADFVAANEHLEALFVDIRETSPRDERLWWPELVAAWNAIQFPQTIDNGIRILDHITVNRLDKGIPPNWRFAHTVRSMRGLAHYNRNVAVGTSKPLPEGSLWKPVTRVFAETAAVGVGQPLWAMKDNVEVVHHSGHMEDFLYYDVPLRGDFEVTCELVANGMQDVQLMYADHWLGINSTGTQYEHGRTGFELRKQEFAGTAIPRGETYQCRMQVKDGIHSYWVNDTQIFEEKLLGLPDPWLAIRCVMASENASVRNLKITGTPDIPTELQLLRQSNLEGWTTAYFRHSMRYSGADWLRSGSFIIGARRTDQRTTMKESLLQYHRPMLEDGEFEYTFAYSDSRHVHPAIGRTAFLLEADGVQEHIITNGIYGSTNLRPDNRTVVAANQLSTSLRLAATNSLKLKLKGDVVTLELNGMDVYRKTLESDNQRFFGFFHYPGASEARIGDVVYRGDWRRSLPAVSEQRFSDQATNE